jgi:hypothetical protein
MDENKMTQPHYIVESTAGHFSSTFNSHSSGVVLNNARYIKSFKA